MERIDDERLGLGQDSETTTLYDEMMKTDRFQLIKKEFT